MVLLDGRSWHGGLSGAYMSLLLAPSSALVSLYRFMLYSDIAIKYESLSFKTKPLQT